MGNRKLKVLRASKVVVRLVRDTFVPKNVPMHSYRHRVWDFIEILHAFNIQGIPRNHNIIVDLLETIGSYFDLVSEPIGNKHSI